VDETEGDLPNFDEMTSPAEAFTPDEVPAMEEAPAAAEKPAAVEEPESKKAKKARLAKEAKEAKEVKKARKAKRAARVVDDFGEEKKPRDLSLYLVLLLLVGIPVALLGLASIAYLNFATAIYLIGLFSIPLLLWISRKSNTVYVALLGIVLAALMTCIYCLWVVLAKYNFDVKAQEAKQRVGMVQPVDRGLLVAAAAHASSALADC
jgi:hypothetical protein